MQLKEQIEVLKEKALEIENRVIEFLSKIPLSYHPNRSGNVISIGFSEYSWKPLNQDLSNQQSEIIGQYRSWYQTTSKLVNKYLPDESNEFSKRYKKKDNKSKENGIIDFLQLNIKVWKSDKSDVIANFRKIFSYQKNLLTSITFLEIDDTEQISAEIKEDFQTLGKNIFIVHGHNEGMKQSIANTLRKLKLNPIILHEQPNKGRTIIEKFTDYSDVSVAIILLSPDDKCKSVSDKGRYIKTRARQNVIFEMGYFIGKLGRECVIILYKLEDNFEFPSDYQGVLYIEYDIKGDWKFKMIKELKSIGYEIDVNLLF